MADIRGLSALDTLLNQSAPLFGEGYGPLRGEVETYDHRLALGIGLPIGEVYEPLAHLHTLVAEALHPTLNLHAITQARLTHHIGLYAHKHEIHTSPIYPIAQNIGVEFHLAQVEILLQVYVVDVPERVCIGKALLDFCP